MNRWPLPALFELLAAMDKMQRGDALTPAEGELLQATAAAICADMDPRTLFWKSLVGAPLKDLGFKCDAAIAVAMRPRGTRVEDVIADPLRFGLTESQARHAWEDLGAQARRLVVSFPDSSPGHLAALLYIDIAKVNPQK